MSSCLILAKVRERKGQTTKLIFSILIHRLKYELGKNTEHTNGIKKLFLTAQCDLSSVEIGITIFISKKA